MRSHHVVLRKGQKVAGSKRRKSRVGYFSYQDVHRQSRRNKVKENEDIIRDNGTDDGLQKYGGNRTGQRDRMKEQRDTARCMEHRGIEYVCMVKDSGLGPPKIPEKLPGISAAKELSRMQGPRKGNDERNAQVCTRDEAKLPPFGRQKFHDMIIIP